LNKKIKVLFVGAFSQPKGGITGGQLVACRSLLSSEISQYIDWITIDSSIESLPCPPVRTRIYKSLKRMLTLHYCLGVKKPHAALIFSASGLSLVEKGVMSLIIKFLESSYICTKRQWSRKSEGHITINFSVYISSMICFYAIEA
jgi:hypothetical protein